MKRLRKLFDLYQNDIKPIQEFNKGGGRKKVMQRDKPVLKKIKSVQAQEKKVSSVFGQFSLQQKQNNSKAEKPQQLLGIHRQGSGNDEVMLKRSSSSPLGNIQKSKETNDITQAKQEKLMELNKLILEIQVNRWKLDRSSMNFPDVTKHAGEETVEELDTLIEELKDYSLKLEEEVDAKLWVEFSHSSVETDEERMAFIDKSIKDKSDFAMTKLTGLHEDITQYNETLRQPLPFLLEEKYSLNQLENAVKESEAEASTLLQKLKKQQSISPNNELQQIIEQKDKLNELEKLQENIELYEKFLDLSLSSRENGRQLSPKELETLRTKAALFQEDIEAYGIGDPLTDKSLFTEKKDV